MHITSLPFHNGEVGLNYGAVTLGVAGGLAPYTWSVSGGVFPPGLTLSSGGTASGKNTAAGKFSFTVRVADSAGGTATAPGGLTVYAAMVVTQPCATKCTIGKGCTRCGGFGTVSRGLGPYSYRILAGSVPSGMSMSALSLKGGFPAGTYSLSVMVTDQLGAQATVGANWSIYAAAKLSAGSSCLGTGAPPSCTATGWTYSGGNPSAAPKVVIVGYKQYCSASCFPTPTAPPPVWTVSAKSGSITISAGGVACTATPPYYRGYVTLALVDTTTCATTFKSNLADLLVDLTNNC